jgi:hypothetical protein
VVFASSVLLLVKGTHIWLSNADVAPRWLLTWRVLLVLQIMAFCENFKTLTQDMAFSPALAGGALMKTKNDLAAAANLITELS